ncbi:FAD/NAD(P)-binding domain-containing protein [Polychaeton citri CBS 116435]|uniref:FAD/NAD(P)-binding domain-containing protein n=1 Tax=Polychaeton citri CBS 116435 TaxID=1314669 RepID=A0A9P4UMN1_9PEZI|nr:FAD/NAD(P)-binding domain-containing protein [Polychaeton citri CBS 116435]
MHVGIVGAGISGLYTALLLRREGHQVTIFEAADRIGGRIYTFRFSPQAKGEDIYFEAGAMRVPRSSLHTKVFDLIRYLNTHSSVEDRIDLIPYILDHDSNCSFFQNEKGSLQEARWAKKADLPEKYWDKTPQELLGSIVLPWLTLLRKDFDSGFQKLLKYDEFSFRAYLRLVAEWPHEVIEFVELFCSQTNQYDLSFTEIIMQNLDFDTKHWVTVKHGMSRVTQSAAQLVGLKNIRLNSRVDRIGYLGNGQIELSATGLHRTFSGTYDAVVIATPPNAVHSIVDRPKWSFMKEQSIRGAHYEPLYKIGLHFRTRFWERTSIKPCFGGQSTTDLRIRWIVYPSNDLGSNGSGVLLLYSWMSDASKWAGLTREQRIQNCLHDLSLYYADDPDVDVYEQYIEASDMLWAADSAGGDAMFLPGQFSRFYEVAKKREGNILFAGEHLSKHHTWVSFGLPYLDLDDIS